MVWLKSPPIKKILSSIGRNLSRFVKTHSSIHESTGTRLGGFTTLPGVEDAVCSNGSQDGLCIVQSGNGQGKTMYEILGSICAHMCEDVLSQHRGYTKIANGKWGVLPVPQGPTAWVVGAGGVFPQEHRRCDKANCCYNQGVGTRRTCQKHAGVHSTYPTGWCTIHLQANCCYFRNYGTTMTMTITNGEWGVLPVPQRQTAVIYLRRQNFSGNWLVSEVNCLVQDVSPGNWLVPDNCEMEGGTFLLPIGSGPSPRGEEIEPLFYLLALGPQFEGRRQIFDYAANLVARRVLGLQGRQPLKSF